MCSPWRKSTATVRTVYRIIRPSIIEPLTKENYQIIDYLPKKSNYQTIDYRNQEKNLDGQL
jgi:hypothetical protein